MAFVPVPGCFDKAGKPPQDGGIQTSLLPLPVMLFRTSTSALALAVGLFFSSCFAAERGEEASSSKKEKDVNQSKTEDDAKKAGLEVATLGAGCFWCIEAVLEQLDGVENVVSGYMGGKTKNPTYRAILKGDTGHAEVVQVTFDPEKISFDTVLSYFWKLHDPTTLNRQGNDVGTQYRSAIFYHTDEQKKKAEVQKGKVDEAGVFKDPIVTEITKASTFYEAEDYHQDYYRLNKNNPRANVGYCRYIIAPKLEKLGLAK